MLSHLGIATHRAEAPVHAILCKPQRPPALERVTEENPSLSASPSATRSCGSYLRQVIPHQIQANVWHSEYGLIRGNPGQNSLIGGAGPQLLRFDSALNPQACEWHLATNHR